MTACNLSPPPDHPLHGTLVACHLPAGHDQPPLSEPHSWDIKAAAARHEILATAIERIRAHYPDRSIVRFDNQLPSPIRVYEVDEDTGERTARPYREWSLASGSWLLVILSDDTELAVWKQTGDVYVVGKDGAVGDDPIIEPA